MTGRQSFVSLLLRFAAGGGALRRVRLAVATTVWSSWSSCGTATVSGSITAVDGETGGNWGAWRRRSGRRGWKRAGFHAEKWWKCPNVKASPRFWLGLWCRTPTWRRSGHPQTSPSFASGLWDFRRPDASRCNWCMALDGNWCIRNYNL